MLHYASLTSRELLWILRTNVSYQWNSELFILLFLRSRFFFQNYIVNSEYYFLVHVSFLRFTGFALRNSFTLKVWKQSDKNRLAPIFRTSENFGALSISETFFSSLCDFNLCGRYHIFILFFTFFTWKNILLQFLCRKISSEPMPKITSHGLIWTAVLHCAKGFCSCRNDWNPFSCSSLIKFSWVQTILHSKISNDVNNSQCICFLYIFHLVLTESEVHAFFWVIFTMLLANLRREFSLAS